MEKKHILSVPAWERENKHIVFNLTTIPPEGDSLNTKRRYREFERLNRKLEAARLPKIALPGKLIIHSDTAIEGRRVALDRSLKQYYQSNGMNPILEDFLLPRENVNLHSSRTSMADSMMTGMDNDSVMTNARGYDAAPPPEVGPIACDSGGSEDESVSATAPIKAEEPYQVWILEMLAARASYRAERHVSMRLARIYMVATIATLLGSFSARSHRWPLVGAALGTAVSAGFALMNAMYSKRIEDKRRRGFGLVDSALKVSDGADVRKVADYLEERKKKPAFKDEMELSVEETAVVAVEEETITVAVTATNQDLATIAEEGHEVSQVVVVSEDIDEALEKRLDDLHTVSDHASIITNIAAVNDPRDPRVAWRWARAVYYHVMNSDDSASAIKSLEEVLSNLQRSAQMGNSALVHKWLAIIHNALGGRKGTIKDRVEGGLAFQHHTNRALEIDPSDPTLHYMTGRFCFDVAGLSWWERQGAKAISGKEPPKATYEEALKHYLHALELKYSPASLLEIGRCYQKLKDDSKAIENFRKAVEYTNPDSGTISPEEESSRNEAASILRSLGA